MADDDFLDGACELFEDMKMIEGGSEESASAATTPMPAYDPDLGIFQPGHHTPEALAEVLVSVLIELQHQLSLAALLREKPSIARAPIIADIDSMHESLKKIKERIDNWPDGIHQDWQRIEESVEILLGRMLTIHRSFIGFPRMHTLQCLTLHIEDNGDEEVLREWESFVSRLLSWSDPNPQLWVSPQLRYPLESMRLFGSGPTALSLSGCNGHTSEEKMMFKFESRKLLKEIAGLNNVVIHVNNFDHVKKAIGQFSEGLGSERRSELTLMICLSGHGNASGPFVSGGVPIRAETLVEVCRVFESVGMIVDSCFSDDTCEAYFNALAESHSQLMVVSSSPAESTFDADASVLMRSALIRSIWESTIGKQVTAPFHITQQFTVRSKQCDEEMVQDTIWFSVGSLRVPIPANCTQV